MKTVTQLLRCCSVHFFIFTILVTVSNAYFQNVDYPECSWNKDEPVSNSHAAILERYEDVTSRANEPMSAEQLEIIEQMREKPERIRIEVG